MLLKGKGSFSPRTSDSGRVHHRNLEPLSSWKEFDLASYTLSILFHLLSQLLSLPHVTSEFHRTMMKIIIFCSDFARLYSELDPNPHHALQKETLLYF